MTDPVSLTAEEEKAARARHTPCETGPWRYRCALDHQMWPCDTARVLATLDRDHATPSVDGLRQALDEMDRLASFQNGITSSAYRHCANLLRTALDRDRSTPNDRLR